jgi:hypothetical protein
LAWVRLDGRCHEYDAFHREYNKATGEPLKKFMEENNIAGPELMTPDHARAVLEAIAGSEDPVYGFTVSSLDGCECFIDSAVGGEPNRGLAAPRLFTQLRHPASSFPTDLFPLAI